MASSLSDGFRHNVMFMSDSTKIFWSTFGELLTLTVWYYVHSHQTLLTGNLLTTQLLQLQTDYIKQNMDGIKSVLPCIIIGFFLSLYNECN